MECELQLASIQDLPVAQNLARFYIYDMSEFLGWACPPTGLFGGCDEFFEDWKTGKNHPYLIRAGNELVGFAGVKACENGHCIQEFFILRKFRRQGIGRRIAVALFEAFLGDWTIQQLAKNAPAVGFWRAVVRDYTEGEFTEHVEPSEWGPMNTIRFCNAE